MTTHELISGALQDMGVLGAGQVAGAQQTAYALSILNGSLIDAWKTDRLLVYTITRKVFTLVAAQASYTVGSGGQIDIERPPTMNMQGSNMNFIDTSANPTIENPLFMLTDDAFQAIPQKTYSATYPTSWYYNPTYTSSAAPYGTLTLWPIPNVSYLQGVFYAPVAATSLTLAATIALPPGYQRFYRTNLAFEMCDGFPVSDTIAKRIERKARESKADVERTNTRLQDMQVDLALVPERRRSNIYVGP